MDVYFLEYREETSGCKCETSVVLHVCSSVDKALWWMYETIRGDRAYCAKNPGKPTHWYAIVRMALDGDVNTCDLISFYDIEGNAMECRE